MSEQLGKIERPEAASFSGKRKLYVVPLLYRWPDAPVQYNTLFDRYWREVSDQLEHLENRIGAIRKVFHEGIDTSGESAVETLKQFETPSYDLTMDRLGKGAELTPVEDRELMSESIDWERFVMLGFASSKVAKLATENLMAVAKKRYDFISSKITETLKENEAGVLFIREGHQIQFPATLEVFSVSPPALDEVHRFLRDSSGRTAPPAAAPKESSKPDAEPGKSAPAAKATKPAAKSKKKSAGRKKTADKPDTNQGK